MKSLLVKTRATASVIYVKRQFLRTATNSLALFLTDRSIETEKPKKITQKESISEIRYIHIACFVLLGTLCMKIQIMYEIALDKSSDKRSTRNSTES